MKILITGGSGFLGSFLIKTILDSSDSHVICVDNISYSGNLNRLDKYVHTYKDRLKIVYHNLRSEFNTTTANLIGKNIDYIVHLAASCHVDKSIKDPLSFVYNNVVGTCNILNFALSHKDTLKKFIYFSTDEVFGPNTVHNILNEYSRYNCTNPYSATKAGAEELAKSFFYTYNLPINIIHCNNIYGEYQQKEAFIPICIRKILNNDTLHIHGSKNNIPIRHYMYVKDVVMYIYDILTYKQHAIKHENILKPLIYNLASKNTHNILDIANKISLILNKKLIYKFTSDERNFTDMNYIMQSINIDRIGYHESFDFDKTLTQVVKWYKKNREWL